MSKILRWIFAPYVQDDVAIYMHSGVGYTGIDHDLFARKHGRIVHNGVGYTGVYYE